MNSNYMFDFNRNSVAATRAAPVARVAPKAAAPVAVARDQAAAPSDRFSMNRLINLKSTGGCRSCN
jgi:DNA primase